MRFGASQVMTQMKMEQTWVLGWTPEGDSLLKFTQVYSNLYTSLFLSLQFITYHFSRKSSIIITITSQGLIAWYLTRALKRWP